MLLAVRRKKSLAVGNLCHCPGDIYYSPHCIAVVKHYNIIIITVVHRKATTTSLARLWCDRRPNSDAQMRPHTRQATAADGLAVVSFLAWRLMSSCDSRLSYHNITLLWKEYEVSCFQQLFEVCKPNGLN